MALLIVKIANGWFTRILKGKQNQHKMQWVFFYFKCQKQFCGSHCVLLPGGWGGGGSKWLFEWLRLPTPGLEGQKCAAAESVVARESFRGVQCRTQVALKSFRPNCVCTSVRLPVRVRDCVCARASPQD